MRTEYAQTIRRFSLTASMKGIEGTRDKEGISTKNRPLCLLLILILFFVLSASASGRDGPSITEQPTDAAVSDGESASFSVTAIGEGTLSYQWYRVGIEGRDDQLVGTLSTYETGAVTTENSGQQYYVIVTDDNGAITSNTVMLTVTQGLSLTRQPGDATVLSGSSATFTVEAAGDQPYTYQWYVDMNTGSFVARGSSEPSYTTHSVTAEQEGWRFYVRVTGTSGAFLDSSIATLHVLEGFVFTLQPEDASIVLGGFATFTAGAIGPGELSYQWYADFGDGRWSAVGSGGTSYTTPAVTMDYNGYTYMCRVFGDEGRSLDSDPAVLTVTLPSPSILSHPEPVYAHVGDTGTFTVQAQGDEPLSYLWSVNQGDGRWNELEGTGSTYTTEALTLEHDGYQYRCTVSDGNGRSTTSESGIVYLVPIITTASLPDGTAGSPYNMILTADGSAPVTWMMNSGVLPAGLDLTPFGTLTGTPMAQGTFVFSVRAQNAAGSDTETFNLVIAPAPMEASPVSVAFDSLAQGYLPPAGKTVTVTNTGNQSISLYQPTAVYYTIGPLSRTAMNPGDTATFTIAPKAGLLVGSWNETIQILGSYGANATVEAAFTCTVPIQYNITSGAGSTYQSGGTSGITIRASGALSNFTGLVIGGTLVGRENYDLAEENTIVTLHQDFLDTLAPGTHTLLIWYTDGYAQTTLTVHDPMPTTGDNDTLALFGSLALLNAAALVLLRKKRA